MQFCFDLNVPISQLHWKFLQTVKLLIIRHSLCNLQSAPKPSKNKVLFNVGYNPIYIYYLM